MDLKRKGDSTAVGSQRRVVFKHTFESSFQHIYDLLDPTAEKSMLAELTTIFQPVKQCNLLYKLEHSSYFTQKRLSVKNKTPMPIFEPSENLVQLRSVKSSILNSTIIGVNALTVSSVDGLQLVIVCKEDMEAGVIHAHIPAMLANKGVQLMSVRRGSERVLMDALAVNRISVLSIKKDGGLFGKVLEICKGVPVIKHDAAVLEETIIKTVETTAPVSNKKQRR